jgi:hypothetical protein
MAFSPEMNRLPFASPHYSVVFTLLLTNHITGHRVTTHQENLAKLWLCNIVREKSGKIENVSEILKAHISLN